VELSSPLELVKEVAVGVRHVLSPESSEVLAVLVAMDVIPDVDIHRIEFRCGNRRFEQRLWIRGWQGTSLDED
jgi:hypothetical protein